MYKVNGEFFVLSHIQHISDIRADEKGGWYYFEIQVGGYCRKVYFDTHERCDKSRERLIDLILMSNLLS